tara:strand:- start:2842 stop:3171 length:330 start_codon:yes stop_codon:yes gene_type:complete
MNVPASNKFLVFVDAADDAAMFPLGRLQSATCAADGVIQMKFAPGSLGVGQAASIDSVAVTIAADGEKAFFEALANEINFGNSASIVVADDVNSVYLGTASACAITLDA